MSEDSLPDGCPPAEERHREGRRSRGNEVSEAFGIRNRNSPCSAVDKRPAQKEP